MAILKALAGFALSILTKLAADELKEWLPRITEFLVKVALKQLPADKRERFAEEWRADLNEIPGRIAKIFYAADFIRAAFSISSSAQSPSASRWAIAKRSRDFILAGMLLVVILPTFLLAAMLIKITISGPVFRTRHIAGLDGKTSRVLLFETIDRKSGKVSKFGKFLRRTSVHTIPNLLSVIQGEVTLIGYGPRPAIFPGKSLSKAMLDGFWRQR